MEAAHFVRRIDVLQVVAEVRNRVFQSAKLLEALCSRYDRVILDTPPCQVASDSILIAHRMDAVLFVVHGTTTGMRTIQAAIKHLRSAQGPLLGHILNQVDARKAYGIRGGYYAYGEYGR